MGEDIFPESYPSVSSSQIGGCLYRRMMLYTTFYHSDLTIRYFFRNIIRVECLPVRATILVSFLPRRWATVVL